MTITGTILLFLSLCILCPFYVHTIVDIQTINEHIQSHKNFSGAVLIAKNDRILLKKEYGFANYEFKIANDDKTKFPTASNTKIFTATAIMLLQERAMVNVADTLDKYIAGFLKTITLHHLLTHTSGIPNYYKHWNTMQSCKDLQDIITIMKTWKLEFNPGSQYSYSNSGYLILAYIIEKVSGMPFESFLQENIFKPFHMNDSGSMSRGLVIQNKASGYRVKDNLLYPSPTMVKPITLLGNGDIYASIADIYTFIQALFTEKIINKESLHVMLTSHISMEDKDRSHGYGWFIRKKCNKRVAECSGALVGFLSKVIRYIDDEVTIIVVSNREDQEEFSHLCDGLLKCYASS